MGNYRFETLQLLMKQSSRSKQTDSRAVPIYRDHLYLKIPLMRQHVLPGRVGNIYGRLTNSTQMA